MSTRSRHRVAARSTCVLLCVLGVASGCANDEGALARAPEEVQRLVAEIEAAPAQQSYRYSYQPISVMFMACLSGVEEVDAVVDADQRAVRFESPHRSGAVYSLDGYVLIDRALLEGTRLSTPFAAIELGPEPGPGTLTRLETALGTGLANQLAGGAWPTHPNDLILAIVSTASSISLAEPGSRTLRFVLDPNRYAEELGSADEQDPDEAPPIIEASVNRDGSIGRIVVRVADPDDPGRVPMESDVYALDYDYSTATALQVPDITETTPLAPDRLPTQPTEVRCQVEP